MASREETDGRPPWIVRKIEGVLIDITGVLYNSGEEGGEVIPGSVQAIERYALLSSLRRLQYGLAGLSKMISRLYSNTFLSV